MAEAEQVGGEPPYKADSALVTFVYLLCRDLVQPGMLEKYVAQAKPADLTNRFLGEYAENCVIRLTHDLPTASGEQEEIETLQRQNDELTLELDNMREAAKEAKEEAEVIVQDVLVLRDTFEHVDMKPDKPWQETASFEDAVRRVVSHAY